MFRRAFFAVLFSLALCVPAFANSGMTLLNAGKQASAAAGCSQATTFIARGTLTGADATAITNFICGMVTDGLIDGDLSTTGCGTYFDALYYFGMPDRTNANRNICSTSFTAVEEPTPGSSPAFTAYKGYTGVDASTTIYLDTQFNPTTASSPKFIQNSAHISMWSNSNLTSSAGGGFTNGANTANITYIGIIPKFFDGNAYYRVNDSFSPSGGIATANSTGHYLANRSGVSTQHGYLNATSQGVTAVTSAASPNGVITILAHNDTISGVGFGDTHQTCMTSIGASLTSGQVTAFYNRLATLTTAMGCVP